jgi:short-subunit dehydrogenase
MWGCMSRQVALVTGASSGLGEHFATLFAKHGVDVVLVARNAPRLEALAERLRVHQVEAHVVAADLADPGAPQAVFDAVTRKGLEIEFLVNNAGYGSNAAFLDLPLAGEANMVEVNCTALLKLTHLFAQPMRARKHGRVLNIASTAAFQPGPYMATYYATKAFVVSFSEALAHELAESGVTVTCSCPGATATNFAARAGNAQSRLFKRPGVARAEDVAEAAFEAMMRGEVLAVHGALNLMAMQSVRFSPRAVVRRIAAALNSPLE